MRLVLLLLFLFSCGPADEKSPEIPSTESSPKDPNPPEEAPPNTPTEQPPVLPKIPKEPKTQDPPPQDPLPLFKKGMTQVEFTLSVSKKYTQYHLIALDYEYDCLNVPDVLELEEWDSIESAISLFFKTNPEKMIVRYNVKHYQNVRYGGNYTNRYCVAREIDAYLWILKDEVRCIRDNNEICLNLTKLFYGPFSYSEHEQCCSLIFSSDKKLMSVFGIKMEWVDKVSFDPPPPKESPPQSNGPQCSVGYRCGNTCISRDKVCHK